MKKYTHSKYMNLALKDFGNASLEILVNILLVMTSLSRFKKSSKAPKKKER